MLKDIPENYRIILRDSVNRINDIANNLLTNYKNQHTSQNEDKLQSWLVASLLESIISEKKLQHQHIAMEAHISSAAYFIFAHFNAIEMKRVISNIVNNAAEAFENEDGKIIISLDVENNQVILKIIDNGCGISEEKLAMVFQEGVSFKQHGSGLGLSHAKKSIEAWSGKIKLESQEGHGTTITITLPVVSPPVWFGATIEVTPQSTIVILDDDDSIHGAWDERLANSEAKHLPVIHFKLPRDLWRWCLENGDKDIVVLSDYEIIGQQMTGLDVLEKIKLAEKSFLITSHYENRNILERCEKAHIKLLPKNLIMHVAILLK
jgi:two-component sensor histidine kinase